MRIGDRWIGGNNPILIQSMTTADTMDTPAVVDEIGRLVSVGCPLVRITVPHGKAAENLPAIRKEMHRRGIRVPLVADIHFTPAAAIISADFVEKVRINPGNYADRKRFVVRGYTDAEYAAEIELVRERFAPLVARLKTNGVALRIGTNHGSLSDRIVNRYGDTPLGMVESALEFVRICESFDYREIVLSVKSSISSVMLEANRLLVARMADQGMDYPIHLGVTEAGGGIEGRIKSAIGIGILLTEGIGDTIRVSLTEDSVHEIEACRAILRSVERLGHAEAAGIARPVRLSGRRATRGPLSIGGCDVGGRAPIRVEARLRANPWSDAGPGEAIAEARSLLGPRDPAAPTARAEILSCEVPAGGRADAFKTFHDALRAEAVHVPFILEWDLRLPGEIHAIEPLLPWCDAIGARVALKKLPLLARIAVRAKKPLRLRVGESNEGAAAARICAEEGCRDVAVLIAAGAAGTTAEALDGDERTRGIPIFIEIPAGAIDAAIVGGRVLLDGAGNGIVLAGEPAEPLLGPDGPFPDDRVGVAYTILQACRLRLTRAEFIACPSCGRTQFDLIATTRRIQERTAHLAGVKIAVMGCIVNGPGEMADADFGYVGSAPGRVDLYFGKTRVNQAIREEEAPDRLCDLILEHGMWTEPRAARSPEERGQ